MAAHHVYAVVLTDADGQISGILTDRDIAIRVLAEGLRPRSTVLSNIVTTKKPVFVSSDTSAADALQTLVKGNFRHLPVLENGEVVGLPDITKSLYDAVCRVERADERCRALAKTLKDVGHQWGNFFNEPSHFPERLTDGMLKIP
ncbi:CBS domain-containing protein CBSCBSPB3-like [Bidens hawaiensis]|uniref:CBS domain-containing protein CBSCBSPB3-like n=1 Tax=Bidens hawaiensis TaxID=980011 RepID=UPI00404B4F82